MDVIQYIANRAELYHLSETSILKLRKIILTCVIPLALNI